MKSLTSMFRLFSLAAVVAMVSFVGNGAHAQTSTGTNLYLNLTGGGINIGAPMSVDFGTLVVASTSYQTTKELTGAANYFFVDDLNGLDAGYYTTIQSSALTTTGYTIPATNIGLRVSPVVLSLLAGTANPLVAFGPSISASYVAIDTPVVYIKRDSAVNSGATSKYGALPWLQVTIPAYASRGAYTGMLTYTLYEN